MLFKRNYQLKREHIVDAIDDYISYLKDRRRLSQLSVVTCRYALNVFVRYTTKKHLKYVDEITNDHLDDWISGLISDYREQGRIKNNTANGYLGHVQRFLGWCRDMDIHIKVRIGWIEHLKPEQIDRVSFTREEVNMALNYANRRAWLMIKMTFDCGLRVGELSQIRLCDIHDDRIRIHGKGSKDADVFISEEVRTHLQDWIKRENIKDYIWPSSVKPDYHITTRQIERQMKIPFERAGLAHFHPHALRYSCATEAYELGGSSDQVKELLRHDNITTTERYIQRSECHVRRVFKLGRYADELLAYDHMTLH